MFSLIKELLSSVWNMIKKVVLKIINFVKNIVGFFKNKDRLKKLEQDQNRIAVAIKENLNNGNYQVVNCLYDKAENTLVDPEEDAKIMNSDEIDGTTERMFGNKEMIVLQ